MQTLILSTFLVLLLVPFSQAFSAESTDNLPTLSVTLPQDRQSVYQDSDGYSVIVGIAENTSLLTPISDVQIQVHFFDDRGNTLEVTSGSTILEVIPSNGQSPFAIHSDTVNPDITKASVSLISFEPSSQKANKLLVYSTGVSLDSTLHFSGVLRNGAAPSSNTNVYLAFYDNFEPPRILGVSTIEIGNVLPNEKIIVEFNEPINSRSAGFLLFSESDVFYSNFVDIPIPSSNVHTKLATISNVIVQDTSGEALSELTVGSTVNIKSNITIQFSADQKSNETAYTYYIQIKESGKNPTVEYIEKFDGRFIGTGTESQIIDWIPEKTGLFFIETFVWDRNNVPIAEQGPFVLILVN